MFHSFKNYGRNIAFSTAAVLLFFALFEGGVRISGITSPGPHQYPLNDRLMWGIVEGQKNMSPGTGIHINSHGFRGREVSEKPGPGSFRIACTGDSSVFGVGVDEGEPFIDVLISRLSSRFPLIDFEPLNFGVPGYSTYQSLYILKEKINRFSPDLVMVANLWSDKYPGEMGQDRERFAAALEGDETVAARVGRFLRVFHFYRLLTGLFHPRMRMISPPEGDGEGKGRTPRVPLDEYEANLKGFFREGKRRGFRVAFLILPYPPDMGGAAGLPEDQEREMRYTGEYRDAMRRVALETGSPLFDASLFFRDIEGEASTYFFDQVHPSEEGHRAIGEFLFEELLGQGWLEEELQRVRGGN